MIEALKQEALLHGNKLQVVPIKHLQTLKKEIDLFKENDELNGFHEFIIQNMYSFDLPKVDFTIKSIILVAIPHPTYAKLEFERQGKKCSAYGIVASDFENTGKYLSDFLVPKNYHIEPVYSIPMKRMAAQCGLAVYGRNNICYIDGMGSNFGLAAYFSDIPCEEDNWNKMSYADACTDCMACVNNCPTGAIRTDRFLIDNDKCLSCLNEGVEEFPEWLPKSAHHCLYDCLKCQLICPMNEGCENNVMSPIKFDEKETNMLLDGIPYSEYSDELKMKAKILGMAEWPDITKAIPRNLRVLFEISEEKED
ncbi:4Fe-4S binding protein [Ruminiclostridium herbifermentans]|uniref:4Fe-4S binding protein n=1 Tax=Ruminiclostridium herbifermentans TaxID=2488810 RepID=A0A7H1VT59_9FIRM|nr:4Fe-4S double cluster binding domain-containing protein [Ruminiclostridium herbifermentans]QNU68571.1 4Fe-4S binding protein [Ruminiclostridium herbifermentans]